MVYSVYLAIETIQLKGSNWNEKNKDCFVVNIRFISAIRFVHILVILISINRFVKEKFITESEIKYGGSSSILLRALTFVEQKTIPAKPSPWVQGPKLPNHLHVPTRFKKLIWFIFTYGRRFIFLKSLIFLSSTNILIILIYFKILWSYIFQIAHHYLQLNEFGSF